MRITTMLVGWVTMASLVFIPVQFVFAGETFWTVAIGRWNEGTNWSNGIPGAFDTAVIDNGGVAQLDSDAARVDRVEVGRASDGKVEHTSGTSSVYVLGLAISPNSQGEYQLSGSGRIETSYLNAGLGGTGRFAQTGGAVLATNNVNAGWDAGSYGTIDLSGNATMAAPQCAIGTFGDGVFIQHGGTVQFNGYLILGWGPSGHGTYTLENGELTMLAGQGYNNVEIGVRGTGYFVQHGGAHTIHGNLVLGSVAGADGTYECYAGHLQADRVLVGHEGLGKFLVWGTEPVISIGVYEQAPTGRLTSEIQPTGIACITVAETATLGGTWHVLSNNAEYGRFYVLSCANGLTGSFDDVVLPGVDWNWGIDGTALWVEHVPEPATLALLAMGGMAVMRRKHA